MFSHVGNAKNSCQRALPNLWIKARVERRNSVRDSEKESRVLLNRAPQRISIWKATIKDSEGNDIQLYEAPKNQAISFQQSARNKKLRCGRAERLPKAACRPELFAEGQLLRIALSAADENT